MAKRILLLILIAWGFTVNAQPTFVWLHTPAITLSLNPDYIGYPTTLDAGGNLYVSGFQNNATDAGADVLGSVFINKYNTAGALQFSNSFSGNVAVYALAADASNNLLIAAGYQGNITFGSTSLSSVEQQILPILIKLDSSGTVLWYFTPTIENNGIVGQFNALATIPDGSIYIGYGDFSNSYITKISADGTAVSTIIQDHVRAVASLDADTDGNIYAAGSCADNNATFNGVVQTADFGYNTYIAKYSADGIFQWARFIEDVTCQLPQVKANTANQVYFSAGLNGAFAFGDFMTEGPTGDFPADFFVTKLNATGDFQWVREVPGNAFAQPGNRNFLETDADGNVYFAGLTRGDADWGNGQATSVTGTDARAFVLKYDESGNMQLAKAVSGAHGSRFDGISVNDTGDIFLAGMSYGDIELDGLDYEQGTDFFPFVTKISNLALGTPGAVKPAVFLYPNPVSDKVSINGLREVTPAVIYNLLGQKVADIVLSPGEATSVQQLSNGVYIVKGNNIKTMQFSKE
jgi:hypothetical protein